MNLLLPREQTARRRSKLTPRCCREKQTTTSDTPHYTWVTSLSCDLPLCLFKVHTCDWLNTVKQLNFIFFDYMFRNNIFLYWLYQSFSINLNWWKNLLFFVQIVKNHVQTLSISYWLNIKTVIIGRHGFILETCFLFSLTCVSKKTNEWLIAGWEPLFSACYHHCNDRFQGKMVGNVWAGRSNSQPDRQTDR